MGELRQILQGTEVGVMLAQHARFSGSQMAMRLPEGLAPPAGGFSGIPILESLLAISLADPMPPNCAEALCVSTEDQTNS